MMLKFLWPLEKGKIGIIKQFLQGVQEECWKEPWVLEKELRVHLALATC